MGSPYGSNNHRRRAVCLGLRVVDVWVREGLATHWSPDGGRFVEAGHKIGDVSCGNAHTLAVTLIEEVWTGTGTNRMKEKQEGRSSPPVRRPS